MMHAKRFFPLAVLAVGLGAFFALGGTEWLSAGRLLENRDVLQGWVDSAPLVSISLFVLVYVVVVAFSLPGAALCSLAAGFLFGRWLGTTLVVVSATTGATILFLLVHTALGQTFQSKAGAWIGKIRAGFQNNAISYMMFLRLVPLFPFFAVNIAGAVLGVSLRVFVATTALGIIPGSFVYV